MTKGELVLITWRDAADPDEPWLGEEGVEKFTHETTLVKSIGWVRKLTKLYVIICADEQIDIKVYGRVTKIPRKMIVNSVVVSLPQVGKEGDCVPA